MCFLVNILQTSWPATLSKRDSIIYIAKFLTAAFFRSSPVAASEKQNDSSKSNLLHIYFYWKLFIKSKLINFSARKHHHH